MSKKTYAIVAGFIGNCAEGGSTFKLYLDDEKTGAKSYHVWLKQLGGGKLTLTTEKEGATNLVLDSGTYVAIISVDENGNIINVASTPTDEIIIGNMKPITSNAIAYKKALNSWMVYCEQNSKTYIHPDVNTGFVEKEKWIKVILSTHESYGVATDVSEYLVKLNLTPYDGNDYRGLVIKCIGGLINSTEGDLLSYFNSTIGWDGGGIFIQNNTQYNPFVATVISMYDR